MSTTELARFLEKVKDESDHDVRRQPPGSLRRGQFRAGWGDAVQGEKYARRTLRSLTWKNLGYRAGLTFGDRTPDEVFDEIVELEGNLPHEDLRLGSFYSMDELREQIGPFELQQVLPQIGDRIVCGLFSRDLNPGAPGRILIGAGGRMTAKAVKLHDEGTVIPVFLKAGTNSWEFQGRFRPVRLLDRADDVRPIWQESGRQDEPGVVLDLERAGEYYFYNTDADSLGEPRPRFRRLIEKGFAATGGDLRYGEELGNLEPGDILLMYENGIGVVAVGTVEEKWDGKSHRDWWYYAAAEETGGHEYRIKVDWSLDLSDDPISVREIRERLGYTPRGALMRVARERSVVELMIEERKASRRRPPDASDLADPPNRVQCTVSRIIRDTQETLSLKKEYGYRCQVCNERIKLGPGWYYAEVHHIRPLGGEHRGSDTRGNMLVLCPNHHAMFDYGAVRFESADELSVDGRACKLTLKHELSAESRDHHNKVIARVPAGG